MMPTEAYYTCYYTHYTLQILHATTSLGAHQRDSDVHVQICRRPPEPRVCRCLENELHSCAGETGCMEAG